MSEKRLAYIDNLISEKQEELKNLKNERERLCEGYNKDDFYSKLFNKLIEWQDKHKAVIFQDSNRIVMMSEDLKDSITLNSDDILAFKMYGKRIDYYKYF